MKIAVVSDDGRNISQHFGRAPYYVVVTVEDGKITNRETREKLAHGHGLSPELHVHHGPGHGMGPAEHDRHVLMSQAIADCEAVICRGMGQGAYTSMSARGVRPVVTDIADIDAAVMAYVDGKIVDHTERLH
jgi:predicted Fe-Mo cluster-binding NifX family protein